MRAMALLLAAAASFAQSPRKDDGWQELLRPGDGRESVMDSCTGCHSLKVVVNARKTREAWAKSINDMIQRGAPVFPDEIEPLTKYLSAAFGADAPPLVNVNSASRADLEKVTNLKPEMAARILEARPFKNAEEFRRAVPMDKAEFERIQYLFKYSD